MATKTNKIMAAVLIAALIVALGVFIFVNLPKETSPSGSTQPGTTILTVTYNGHKTNYTLKQLENESFNGTGGYRTNFPAIKGQGNYTGVRIQTLIRNLKDAPNNYSIMVFSSDGTNRSFNFSNIMGLVPTYDPYNASNAHPIGFGGLTMILAYKYEGAYLNESKDGKLKIAFVDDQGSITSSGLWWKYVDAIQVISE
jgi:hypothetical protein